MITADTIRRHFVKISNGDITLYHKEGTVYGNPIQITNVYCEFDRKALIEKYGINTRYRGLIILDGLKPYVSCECIPVPEGYFTIAPGDKIVNTLTSDVLRSGMSTYSVEDVAEYVRDGLLSVEVTLG